MPITSRYQGRRAGLASLTKRHAVPLCSSPATTCKCRALNAIHSCSPICACSQIVSYHDCTVLSGGAPADLEILQRQRHHCRHHRLCRVLKGTPEAAYLSPYLVFQGPAIEEQSLRRQGGYGCGLLCAPQHALFFSLQVHIRALQGTLCPKSMLQGIPPVTFRATDARQAIHHILAVYISVFHCTCVEVQV